MCLLTIKHWTKSLGHRLKYYISLSELKANHSMSIQVTTFVLCHIILPNLFVVTCMSHCGECQLGGKFYAEICCLKHCLIVFQNIHFCFVCYFVVLWSRHMRVRCRGLCWSFLHGSVALIDHDTACAVFQIIHFCFFITMYCGQGMPGSYKVLH